MPCWLVRAQFWLDTWAGVVTRPMAGQTSQNMTRPACIILLTILVIVLPLLVAAAPKPPLEGVRRSLL